MPWQSPQRPDVARVLVADDDRDLLQLISTALQHDGHDVRTVSSGNELQDLLVKHAICYHGEGQAERGSGSPTGGQGENRAADVLISDVRMPGCSGLEVLADLQGRCWAPPVIVISGALDDAMRDQAQRLGASAVLAKPLDLDTLRAAVAAVVRQRHEGDRAARSLPRYS